MSLTPKQISEIFQENDWHWSFDSGESRPPTEADVFDFVKGLGDALDSRGGGMVESGRLIVKTDNVNNVYDVYLHVGEIKEITNE